MTSLPETQLSARTPGAHSHNLRFRQEMGAVVKLAAPLALAQLAQMGMGLTDTILLGALGRDALAAGGLGAGVFLTVSAVLQGLVMSVGILVAHARGANTPEKIAPVLRAGFLVATAAALPLMLAMWNAEAILLFVGEPEKLSHDVAAYVAIIMWGAPATMWLGVQRSYLAAMNRPRVVMTIAMAALVFNGLLNYGLIHGEFGLPEMGYLGSATATLIALWLMTAATALAMRATPHEHTAKGIDWKVVREVANLGWPISITLGVEIMLFMVGGLMAGVLGNTALAAHHVALNVASVTFMVPLGIAQAANVRVGFHMGGGVPHAARRAAFTAFMLGVGFMVLMAAAMMLMPRQIALLFNLEPARDAEVIVLVVDLLIIAAFFQVFDGAQCIAAGALRGMKDTRTPMVLAGLSYWAVGFPVAWALGFPAGWGAQGIWWGLAIGLAAAAVVLNARLLRLSSRLMTEADAARPVPLPVAA